MRSYKRDDIRPHFLQDDEHGFGEVQVVPLKMYDLIQYVNSCETIPRWIHLMGIASDTLDHIEEMELAK